MKDIAFLKKWIAQIYLEDSMNMYTSRHIDMIHPRINKKKWMSRSLEIYLKYNRWLKRNEPKYNIGLMISVIISSDMDYIDNYASFPLMSYNGNIYQAIDIITPPEFYLFNREKDDFINIYKSMNLMMKINDYSVYHSVNKYDDSSLEHMFWIFEWND